MGWVDKTLIIDNQSVADTEVYSSAVTLRSDEVAHVQVHVNFASTPTDNLLIRVYSTLDATSQTWDNVTFVSELTVSNATDPSYVSFTVEKCYSFRLGVVASGTTDTHVVDAWYRADGEYKDCNLDI